MQLPKISTLLRSLFVSLALLSVTATVALASAPQVIVKVKDQDGKPLKGVYVKWVDKFGNYIFSETAASSYDASDEFGNTLPIQNGEALFRSWDIPPEKGGFPNQSQYGPQIDHDFNPNTASVPQWEVVYGAEGRFGCGQNPQQLSVVVPSGMGYTCNNNSAVLAELKNQELVNRFEITCQREAPQCPGNVRQVSCDPNNQSVTVAWDAPPGGADGYTAYFDLNPDQSGDAGDFFSLDTSSQLGRTEKITFGQRYLIRVRSFRDFSDGRKESPISCLAEIKCENEQPPKSPCPPDERTCNPGTNYPTANISGAVCPERPGEFYYEYTMSDIQLSGNPFFDSHLMISFTLNDQTQKILEFLNDSNNPDFIPNEIGYSEWQEQNRNKAPGDYFGFYVQKYTAPPTGPFILNDSTKIGLNNKTIGELRQFLAENNLPTKFTFKGNISSDSPTRGILFNSNLPAGTIDLSTAQTAFCAGETSCDEATACISDIVITGPEESPDGLVTPEINGDNGDQQNITFSWESATAEPNTVYEVLLYNSGLDGFSSAAEAYQYYLENGNDAQVQYRATTEGNQTFNVFSMKKTLSFAVRARKISCPSDGISPNTCSWIEKPIQLGFEVSGKFLLNPVCQVEGSRDVSLLGSTVAPNGTLTAGAEGYSVTLPYTDAGSNISLSIAGDDYICTTESSFSSSCPTANGTVCTIANVNEPATDKHFYVKSSLSQFSSWWQARGGLVYAKTGITSNLPIMSDGQPSSYCTDAGSDCEPFLVRREYLNNGTPKTAGVPATGNGFSSLINGWWTHRGNNDTDPQPHAEGTIDVLTGESKEDFAFFKRLIGNEITAQTSPGVLTELPTGTQLGTDATVLYYEGDVILRPEPIAWNISDKRVIIVNGNIRVESNGEDELIKVSNGGFLAFVASGNITFAKEVGSDSASVAVNIPNVEGIFIADKTLITESYGASGGDKKFIGAGSFVGWSNVSLQRHFDNPADQNDTINKLKNTNMPVEAFFFRPDFAINAPEFMKSATFTWKEVN